MQTLLPAIKTALQGMSQLHRKGDCYITPNHNFMPTGTRQPCIGIKDAGVVREELVGEGMTLTMRVDLVGFVRMTADGSDAVCGENGVYVLLDAATALLVGNRLGLSDVLWVQIGPDRPTELFQAENNQWIVKLVRTLIYTLERPSI